MGMANVEERITPKPRYKNTVVCSRCHAEYNPKTKWGYGYYEEGTTGAVVVLGKLPEGVCPGCRKKPDVTS